MIEAMKKITQQLLRESTSSEETASYALQMAKGISSTELAHQTAAGLLRECGIEKFCLRITHDPSGAPVAAVTSGDPEGGTKTAAEKNWYMKHPPLISLTDEGNLRACLAVLKNKPYEENLQTYTATISEKKGGREITGVGIDLADVEELSGILRVSGSRLNRWFGEKEAERLKKMDISEAKIYLAEQFGKREAAFKAVSAVYRSSREAYGGKPLPVSFMDFMFPEGKRAVPRGMTAELLQKEGLYVSAGSTHLGKLAGAVAVCHR